MYSSSYSYDDGWSEEDQPSPKEAFLDVEGIVVLIATCMSLLGSSITVATFVLFKDMRSSSLTFALWLAAASIGYSLLTFLKPFDDNRFVCEFVAFFTTYCNLVAVFTATVVAYGNSLAHCFIFQYNSALSINHRNA